ncbi:hypothetical protein HMPREF0293_1897 [Corynebacterium glucuronolyticum ATCC 51866]|uniref:Uncharacterized protein n=1 Tax=Corynebacterium glucuronolyticum ATCC 51866 TaxID=548478 RepID=A0ABM9XNL1_9CORY|nr:hypothetical protein HMPREF0293_1897 [Corynebacterium glucuronolyticum ATCC 51866]
MQATPFLSAQSVSHDHFVILFTRTNNATVPCYRLAHFPVTG